MHCRYPIAVAFLAMAACAGDEGDSDEVVVRDTVIEHAGSPATVRIASNPGGSAEAPLWRLTTEPLLDLGGEGGSEEESLFRVAGAVRLGDGRVVVADGGSMTLKVFAPDGTLSSTMGGAGSGPGEFRRIQWFGSLGGDSLLVYDLGLGRVSVFSPEGTLAREARIGATAGSPQSSVRGVFADGSLLATGFIDLGGRVPDGLARHETQLYRLGADGMLLDSLGGVRGGQGWYTPIGEGGFSFRVPPFARSTEIVAAGDRLYIADSEEPEVRVKAPDGRPVMLVRWADDARPVDDALADAARARELAEAEDEAERRAIAEMYDGMPLPGDVPSFARVRVDEAGHIWVREWAPRWEERTLARWRIFDPAGVRVAEAELPADLEPTHIGADFVLGTWRDALDVEHVRLYGLERGEATR